MPERQTDTDSATAALPFPHTPTGWRRWLPGLSLLRGYPQAWFRQDLSAGLVLMFMLVPVGVAYAEASGVPGIYGLYTTVVALLVYALFGPSRILVLGPDSSLAPLILAVVLPLSAGDPARAVLLAGMMAVVAGTLCTVAGVLRLGFITELLSKPIRYGYMNGIALTVLISQLPRLFGLSLTPAGPLGDTVQLLQRLWTGTFNPYALAVGAGTLGLILLLRRHPRIPGILIAVVAATLAVQGLGLEPHGVAVLGPLPQGLPSFVLPWVEGIDGVQVVLGGCAVALVAFADTSVLSRSYAARTRRYVDPSQEMLALGVANLAAGFFQGFPVSSSSSRTPVAEAAGARSQMTGIVGAVAVALLLLLAPRLLEYLPASALAAVVIAAALHLFELADLRRILRIQPWEFWLSMTCFAGVVVFGAVPGICFAVVLALIEFLWDAWRPHYAVLGRVNGIRGFHDLKRYPQARQVPGLLLFRWDAPLFFANAELFQRQVLQSIGEAPQPLRRVVVAAEPVTSVDVTSADLLRELAVLLRQSGIELHFAEMKDPVKDKLVRFELLDTLGSGIFHPTVGAAVDAYLRDHRVDWTP